MSENAKLWNDVIVRYYGDQEFANKLDSSPTSTLKEMGITVPDGANVTMHKNTSKNIHLVMPSNPAKELNEDFLSGVAAGYCGGSSSRCWE